MTETERRAEPAAASEPEGHTPGAAEVYHPSVKDYIEIGVILAVLTALEIGLFYAPVPREVAIPLLLILTVAKFVLVVLWFMHLRFDSTWFQRIFWSGVGIASVLFLVTVLISVTA